MSLLPADKPGRVVHIEGQGQSWCVVAWCRCCEHIVFAALDKPERNSENAREIAKLLKAGFKIGSLPTEQVRNSVWCCDKPRTASASQTGATPNTGGNK